jgi:hypothetical protein
MYLVNGLHDAKPEAQRGSPDKRLKALGRPGGEMKSTIKRIKLQRILQLFASEKFPEGKFGKFCVSHKVRIEEYG